ncbi:GNAT family N-acetyltransferase [Alphaproteobacteria bacterium]|nr:GNAT family N-acetyltransferase [Alphaproteobacteria bacterium]
MPTGYAILSQKPDDHAHLHHFIINHAHRAKGWGTRMITEMIARARADGAILLTLKAERSNADALRF